MSSLAASLLYLVPNSLNIDVLIILIVLIVIIVFIVITHDFHATLPVIFVIVVEWVADGVLHGEKLRLGISTATSLALLAFSRSASNRFDTF